MGTKAKWRGDKLAFHSAPMFTGVAAMTANVTASSSGTKTETVIIAAPDYAVNWTTNTNQAFRAVAGGVISATSATCALTLRRGTVDIVAVTLNNSSAAVSSTNVPWGVEFNGRIVNVDSSGMIAAAGKAWATWSGGTTTVCNGTTGAGTAYASSGHALTSNSATGLNITFQMSTAAGSAITATHGYIQFFEG